MEISKIIKTKEGRIKISTPDGGPSYTFWHEGELRDFATRDLHFKPADVPLQEAVKAILKIAPKLEAEKLGTIKGQV